ncbi:MAG: response regulator [Desulfobacteraceae bacterium]|nr:response regulator [Desulfobacteraceae bacterium]
MKILIVDDEPRITKYITQILNKWGHTSKSAATGKKALQIFKDNSFDMILLDIMLPDYKGYDLIPKFKNINSEIGIITMTGHNSRELEIKVRNQGILYYMVKPIETKNFKLILDHIKNKE